MKKKELHIIADKDKYIENLQKKNLLICDKCRKFLGKIDNDYEIITWKKININNCYCYS